jgi:peptidyl-prolyl cis-trans isomerase A (cyclophilin A)
MPENILSAVFLFSAILISAVTPGSTQNLEFMEYVPDPLMNPSELNEEAPGKFEVLFDTSKGEFTVTVTRNWSPKGADRFYNLVKNGYYDDCRFFRVVKGFMVQFGINGNPQLNEVWRAERFEDDKVKESNARAYITFAKTNQPDTRTTQLFINYADNSFLDSQGFSPLGQITEGMEVIDSINDEYGEKPDQRRIQLEGNAYLEKAFPNLDFIKTAIIIPGTD